jgi:hypothetical protein
MYRNPVSDNEIHFFTNHIVGSFQNEIDFSYKKDGESITVKLTDYNNEKADYGNIYLFKEAINTSKRVYQNSQIDIRESDYILKFYRTINTGAGDPENESLTDKNETVVSMWLEDGQKKVLFKYKDSLYEADEDITSELNEIIKKIIGQQ